jgi:hypothetical protein
MGTGLRGCADCDVCVLVLNIIGNIVSRSPKCSWVFPDADTGKQLPVAVRDALKEFRFIDKGKGGVQ